MIFVASLVGTVAIIAWIMAMGSVKANPPRRQHEYLGDDAVTTRCASCRCHKS